MIASIISLILTGLSYYLYYSNINNPIGLAVMAIFILISYSLSILIGLGGFISSIIKKFKTFPFILSIISILSSIIGILILFNKI